MLCTEQEWWKARELKIEYTRNGVWATPSHRYLLIGPTWATASYPLQYKTVRLPLHIPSYIPYTVGNVPHFFKQLFLSIYSATALKKPNNDSAIFRTARNAHAIYLDSITFMQCSAPGSVGSVDRLDWNYCI